MTCLLRSILLLLPLTLAAPAGAIIAAAEGSQYLYLTTGPGDLHGGGGTGSDLNGDGEDEGDVSSFSISFTVASAGFLSIDWDLLTGEVTGGVSDWFRVVLDGVTILSESILTDSDDPLPPPGVDHFAGGGLLGPDGSFFEDGRLGWSTISANASAGDHTLEFFVYDDEDLIVDTALLVDRLALTGVTFEGFETYALGETPAGSSGRVTVEGFESFSQVVPEPRLGALLLAGGALLLLAGRR